MSEHVTRGGLAEIEHALERYGLLLEHDRELPSVSSIVAGEPIAGSWWGHPLGHAIYDLLGALHEATGKLKTKRDRAVAALSAGVARKIEVPS